LRAIVGPAHVLAGVELSPFVIEGRTPEAAVLPGSVDAVAAVIVQAAEAGVPVVPWGGGSAIGVGVPAARPGLVLLLTRPGVIVEATVKLRPVPDEERLVATRFERLTDAGAAVRALLASVLIPNAVELLDATSTAALGLPPATATLAVGFDGLGDQVDWQVAELASLVAPCGGAKPVALPPPTWERLASAARDAFGAPAGMMTLSVRAAVVAGSIE